MSSNINKLGVIGLIHHKLNLCYGYNELRMFNSKKVVKPLASLVNKFSIWKVRRKNILIPFLSADEEKIPISEFMNKEFCMNIPFQEGHNVNGDLSSLFCPHQLFFC